MNYTQFKHYLWAIEFRAAEDNHNCYVIYTQSEPGEYTPVGVYGTVKELNSKAKHRFTRKGLLLAGAYNSPFAVPNTPNTYVRVMR